MELIAVQAVGVLALTAAHAAVVVGPRVKNAFNSYVELLSRYPMAGMF